MPAIEERQRQGESVMTTTKKNRTTELCRAGLTQEDIRLAESLTTGYEGKESLTIVEVLRRGLIIQRQIRNGFVKLRHVNTEHET
jgi:hypothetical protein